MSTMRSSFSSPLCRLPRNSPAPRICRSRFARSKPSSGMSVPGFISVIAASRSDSPAASLIRMQNARWPRRPTRPRSWWSCARPKRSAPRMIIIVAPGMSIPTSTTVVATSTSSSRAAKRRMTSSRSRAGIRPCSRPTRTPARSFAVRSRNVASALGMSSSGSSTIRGVTTNACSPAETRSFTQGQIFGSVSWGRTSVRIS